MVKVAVRYIQTNESLAGTWHACDKADCFPLPGARLLNNLVNRFGCCGKIPRARVASRDRFHRMPGIQRARRFNDRCVTSP